MLHKNILILVLLSLIHNSLCTCTEDYQREDNLNSIIFNEAIKFVFVGGKGGVGKTTVSSSLAIQLAKHRQGKVLLISTDPAHSLSDAFQPQQFNSKPTEVEGIDNLSVMEVDPSVLLKDEIDSWKVLGNEAGMDLIGEVQQFSQWITSIPGIDEATALISVIQLIEKGEYSCIVLDTAPTGHTLKLLQLPSVLDVGLTKLQGWQATLWDYSTMFQQFMGGGQGQQSNLGSIRKRLEKKLKKYKRGVKKVSRVLRDNDKTTFVTVCIAEYLSVSESKRLLSELKVYEIHSSHIVVNQLVDTGFDLNSDGTIAEDTASFLESFGHNDLANKVQNAVNLCLSRQFIQKKYLTMLDEAVETECLNIVKLPLLASEVTGVNALNSFSERLTMRQTKESSSNDEL